MAGGEFEFIRWIVGQHRADDFLRVPPGDDLAALNWPAGELLLVGVDQVMDGVHFDSAVHTPAQIGRKVMNRNLSDCAAMACLPAAAVATVALPKGVGENYARELYLGMSTAGAKYGCRIVGGDTGSWNGKLVATVAILGRAAGIAPVTRSGAKVGDGVYVTGALGGSLLGRHIDFEPRVTLARELAQKYRLSAMIDISDGLSRDLGHICRLSGVGAVCEAGLIPVHGDARRLAEKDGRLPLEHALHDGEDHELLFTSADEVSGEGISRIGEIVGGGEVILRENGRSARLEERGWQHQL